MGRIDNEQVGCVGRTRSDRAKSANNAMESCGIKRFILCITRAFADKSGADARAVDAAFAARNAKAWMA